MCHMAELRITSSTASKVTRETRRTGTSPTGQLKVGNPGVSRLLRTCIFRVFQPRRWAVEIFMNLPTDILSARIRAAAPQLTKSSLYASQFAI